MGSEWQETTVGEQFDLANGFAFNSKDFEESGIPVIKIKNVKAGYFSEHTFSYVSPEFLETRQKKLARVDDLLISMSGNRHDGSPETWVGKIARFDRPGHYFINQRVGALRVKDASVIDPRFASYLLSSWDYQQLFLSIATSSGGQANLSPAQILGASFEHPPLPEQKAIAHILGTLDDKIELNRRMNATLEGMAQALFKSWFVDFDPVLDNAILAGNPIPEEFAERAKVRRKILEQNQNDECSVMNDELKQSSTQHSSLKTHHSPQALFPAAFHFTEELGWIPEGWEAKKIEDCISRFSAGKKYSQKTAEDGGCVPILDQGKSGIIGYHNDEPGVKASTDDPIIVFANHTCYMRLIQFDFSAIQNVLPYRGNGLNIYWIYEATKGRQDFIEYKGHWPDFVLNTIVVPSIDLVDVFGDVVEASYRKIYANTLENEGLTKLRDTLLPKLISGELRLSEAEQLTEEALA